MTGWLQLTDEQRRTTLTEAAANNSITAKAIEKDWWVTLTLKALFSSAYAEYLVFKGGTSLSKCWKVISRFSEDIDIALDPTAFGMNYEETPSKAFVKRLKRSGCQFTSDQLREELQQRILGLGLPEGMVNIIAADVRPDFPDTDPQTLYVRYSSLFPPIGYIPDEVKIEVSVRSLKIPFTNKPVQSLLNEYYPQPIYNESPFEVTVVEARKTFLEKAFLLHEEFKKPDRARIRAERMSRHPYDLVSMMNTEIGKTAISDYALYDHLITHRKWYTGFTYLDYEKLGHRFIEFILPDDLLDLYREDYETMRREMIYREAQNFDELVENLKILQGRVRMKMEPISLEEVIECAKSKILTVLESQENGTSFQIVEDFAPQNRNTTYTLTFTIKDKRAIFESVEIQNANAK